MIIGLDIGNDEEVLAESSGVFWRSAVNGIDDNFNVLVLTNKRIYGIYQKNKGLFKKASEEIVELQLNSIKITNNQLMVSKKWDFNSLGWILEIHTNQGIHNFIFSESSKKKTALWELEIFKCFGLLPPEDKIESKIGNVSAVATGLKDMTVSILGKDTIKKDKKISIEDLEQEYEEKSMNKPQCRKISFCSNCGLELNDGAKFCHSCGTQKSKETKLITPTLEEPRTVNGNYRTRVEEFAGTVLKCPNCGNVISSLDAVCSACGMHITGKKASETVQKLSYALMEVEKVKHVENKGGLFAQIGYEERITKATEDYYSRKLTLIKTFPIPNTVDEIYEFMLLATTNIDVKISKNTLWSKFDGYGSSDKQISDAWIQKMRQAYQKAVISFPNDQVFKHIQNIYFDKMNELKIEP